MTEKAIYLHSNGNLIEKSSIVYQPDPSYFSSPFVLKVWHKINEYTKEDWKMMLADAIIKGALPLEVKRVALDNKLSENDVENIWNTPR